MITRRTLSLSGLALGALLLPGGPLTAQNGPGGGEAAAGRPLATRQQLEALSQKGGPGGQLAQLRLREGDFRPGDLIRIEVQAESTLTDTFTVTRQRALELPSPVSAGLPLAGVLRSELEPKVVEHIRRFVNDARVRAWPLVRISVQGEVARAGVYGVEPDAVISDVLMAAGGTTADADLKKLKIERDGRQLYTGKELNRALADRRTIDDAALRDGDRIVIGGRARSMEGFRFAAILVSIAGGLYGLTRAF